MQNTPKESKECCKCNGKEPEIVSSGTGKIDGHICFCSCHKMNTPKTIEQRCEVILENLEDKKIFVNGLDGYSEYNIRANKKKVIIKALSEQDRISRKSERESLVEACQKIPEATRPDLESGESIICREDFITLINSK